MADASDDEHRERLKAALWYSIGKMVDEESLKRNRNATAKFIAALTEMTWTQIENVAIDLESFSHHAGRSTVNTDDVLLMTRKNQDLHDLMKSMIDKQKVAKAKGKGKANK